MRIRTARAWVIAAIAALGVGLTLLSIRTSPTSFPLPNGGELRVAAVVVGTNHLFSAEPRWKRLLRFALPDRWEKPLGKFVGREDKATNATLWVWLFETDAAGRGTNDFTRHSGQIIFNHSYREFAYPFWSTAGYSLRRFDIFPRDQKTLQIAFDDHRESMKFTVANPHPIQPESWLGKPLPQVVETNGLRLLLQPYVPRRRTDNAGLPANLRIVPTGSSKPGWFYCRCSTVDNLGNRRRRGWTHFYSNPLLAQTASALKLNVEIQEYLSAGFMNVTSQLAFQELMIIDRARELGARKISFFRPGRFHVDLNAPIQQLSNESDDTKITWSASESNDGALDLEVSRPGILLVAEAAQYGIQIGARLRERIGPHPKKVFAHAPIATATNRSGANQLIAIFFTPATLRSRRPPVDPPIAGIDTQLPTLEAELVVNYPPVEFAVDLGENPAE
ncbi:hypothetical protein GC207_12320 [bacterium]|nr:hypothetical protein [bacterium]